MNRKRLSAKQTANRSKAVTRARSRVPVPVSSAHTAILNRHALGLTQLVPRPRCTAAPFGLPYVPVEGHCQATFTVPAASAMIIVPFHKHYASGIGPIYLESCTLASLAAVRDTSYGSTALFEDAVFALGVTANSQTIFTNVASSSGSHIPCSGFPNPISTLVPCSGATADEFDTTTYPPTLLAQPCKAIISVHALVPYNGYGTVTVASSHNNPLVYGQELPFVTNQASTTLGESNERAQRLYPTEALTGLIPYDLRALFPTTPLLGGGQAAQCHAKLVCSPPQEWMQLLGNYAVGTAGTAATGAMPARNGLAAFAAGDGFILVINEHATELMTLTIKGEFTWNVVVSNAQKVEMKTGQVFNPGHVHAATACRTVLSTDKALTGGAAIAANPQLAHSQTIASVTSHPKNAPVVDLLGNMQPQRLSGIPPFHAGVNTAEPAAKHVPDEGFLDKLFEGIQTGVSVAKKAATIAGDVKDVMSIFGF